MTTPLDRLRAYDAANPLRRPARERIKPRTKSQKAKRSNPEYAIQVRIVVALRKRGIFVAHVPNQAKSAQDRLYQSVAGAVAGFPDLIVFLGRGRIACVEVKAPGKALSERQAECHDRLRDFGVHVCVAHSVEEAIEFVEGIL